MTTDDICKFLEDSSLDKDAVQKIITDFNGFQTTPLTSTKIKSIIRKIQELPIMNHQWPIWSLYGAPIISILELGLVQEQFEGACTRAVKMLETLKIYTELFHQLRRQQLKSGDGFEGRMHAEVFLGSLVSL